MTWRIELEVPSQSPLDLIEQALAENGEPVSITKIPPSADWRIEVYYASEPDRGTLTDRLSIVAALCAIATPEFVIEKMAAIDWVKQVQENSPPVFAGRFFVYGSHVTDPVPEGQIGIRIDAGAAFGTGTHETTQGCLMALDQMSQRGLIRSALDLGCGSGILAIGMAMLWATPILAADNDPVAVGVTAENSAINNVADRVHAICSDGFQSAAIDERAPFDLIAANILAGPLISLAPDIAHHMSQSGHVVLSGLLDRQSNDVILTYESAGLVLTDKIVLGEWHTLVMRRP